MKKLESRLSLRMQKIIHMIDNVKTVADIGCDHGLVSAVLIEQRRAERVLACDISKKSLQKTEKLISSYGLKGIEPVVSDGLLGIAGNELDCIVVAGMGGLLIRDILANGLSGTTGKKDIILAPQGNEYELRVFLYEIGYYIMDESIVKEDNHYYQIIFARQGERPLPDELSLRFGFYPQQRKDPLQKEFLQYRLCEYETIIAQAMAGKDTSAYILKIQEITRQITEGLRCL